MKELSVYPLMTPTTEALYSGLPGGGGGLLVMNYAGLFAKYAKQGINYVLN